MEQMNLYLLKGFQYLQKEISDLEKRILELENTGGYRSNAYSNFGKSPAIDPTAQTAMELAALKAQLETAYRRRYQEEKSIWAWLEEIEDPRIRLILQYRHIRQLSWQQIAMRLGGGNTADGVRKAYSRFLNGRSLGHKCPDTPPYTGSISNDGR